MAYIQTLPGGTFYRGVEDKSFELIPSIGRKNIDERPINEIEKILIKRFKNEAVPFLNQIPENDYELLTIAQHHGLPTRLLDWTRSPLVALYFATENHIKESDFAVYITPTNVRTIEDITGKPPIDGLDDVYMYPPKHLTRRVSAQSGFFSIHPNPTTPWQHPEITKIIMPCSIKEAIKNTLSISGINAATIFPDLDGLTKSLKFEYGFWE
nr:MULTISPECIES: FRG domain-containing protein [unclassified Psychrosphaera]